MERLAELSGVNASTISRIEAGKIPRIDTAWKLSKALDIGLTCLCEAIIKGKSHETT